MINELDFSKLKYNVDKVPSSTKIIDAYPELKEYAVIKKFKHTYDDKVIRSIILLYSPNSPFVDAFFDVNKRYEVVFDYLNLERYKDEIPQMWIDIFTMKDEKTKELVNCFLTEIHYVYEFLQLVADERAFMENTKARFKEISTSDEMDEKKKMETIEKKTKLRIENENLVVSIRKYREILFTTKDVEEKLQHYIPIRPENALKKINIY